MTGAECPAAEAGREWSERAAAWAELWAPQAEPARVRLLDATGTGRDTRLLDLGCGSGELCALALARGATVSGIDAAEGMIALARVRAPAADLRVGAMEALSWPDRTFDVVTAVNALPFAADLAVALREARRVTRPGGAVAVAGWAEPEHRDVLAVTAPLRDDPVETPPLATAGGLAALVGEAGLVPERGGLAAVPLVLPDGDAVARAFLAPGDRDLRDTVLAAAARFRRPDGSYRFENRFRWLVARVTGGPPTRAPGRSA